MQAPSHEIVTLRALLAEGSRYELLFKIARGGMATVFLGRLRSTGGFSRLVAIKRAHPHLARDPAFVRLLLTEAHLASQLHHPNLVAVLDVEQLGAEVLLIMEYIDGPALASLLDRATDTGSPIAPSEIVRVIVDACTGLHAAHEARDQRGRALELVHRDISPHNLLLGADGIARIADFGIAKGRHSESVSTLTGALKGKARYMAPEYVGTGKIDARGDVFSLGVVLWEGLTGKPLYEGTNDLAIIKAISETVPAPPSRIARNIPPELDAVVLKALDKNVDRRFQSARAFGDALEEVARRTKIIASHAEVGERVRKLFGRELDERLAHLSEFASSNSSADRPPPPPQNESKSLARPDGESTATIHPKPQTKPQREPQTPMRKREPSDARATMRLEDDDEILDETVPFAASELDSATASDGQLDFSEEKPPAVAPLDNAGLHGKDLHGEDLHAEVDLPVWQRRPLGAPMIAFIAGACVVVILLVGIIRSSSRSEAGSESSEEEPTPAQAAKPASEMAHPPVNPPGTSTAHALTPQGAEPVDLDGDRGAAAPGDSTKPTRRAEGTSSTAPPVRAAPPSKVGRQPKQSPPPETKEPKPVERPAPPAPVSTVDKAPPNPYAR